MSCSKRNIEKLEILGRLEELETKVQRVRPSEKLAKQAFHYDAIELFEPVTKTITDPSKEIHEECRSKTKTNEELTESIV